MAPGHHLLVVTFGLCGLLFLLHVDSVNSLWCKRCSSDHFPGCDPENSQDTLCGANELCSTTVRFFGAGVAARIMVVARNCSSGRGRECDYNVNITMRRVYYCQEDRCNNQPDSGFDLVIIPNFQCSVNQLTCHRCSTFLPPRNCALGYTRHKLCREGEVCATTVWAYSDGTRSVVARHCFDPRKLHCIDGLGIISQQNYYCTTNLCNNQPESSFTIHSVADIECSPK